MSDDRTTRTYGIWGLVAVFTLLAAGGLVVLLVAGMPEGDTRRVVSPQTLPDGATSTTADDSGDTDSDEGGSSTTTTSTTAATTPTTAEPDPDLPDGVREVLRSDGVISYAFDVPEPVPGSGLRAVVAPATAVAADGGNAVSVTVGCAVSSDEALAQVSVSESPTTIAVVAVVVAPDQGPECDDASRTLVIPLGSPVGDRAVVVVPVGTPVPDLETG